MANLQGFDANTVDPSVALEVIPAGKYLAMITDSEMKSTKNNEGSYLKLVFQILEGPHKDCVVLARLNLQNKNATAVKIAMSELSSICRAVGVMVPKDSCELHNLPMTITVKCVKREDTGDIYNEIKGYAKKDAAATASTPAVTTGQNSTAPWKR